MGTFAPHYNNVIVVDDDDDDADNNDDDNNIDNIHNDDDDDDDDDNNNNHNRHCNKYNKYRGGSFEKEARCAQYPPDGEVTFFNITIQCVVLCFEMPALLSCVVVVVWRRAAACGA